MPTNTQNTSRPDPDALLQKINKAERGKLTVFLGAAAGVGKTYTMLEAAHERYRSGSDVVIGWVETHGRQETEQMVVGLPRMDPKAIEYRGKTLLEMDNDGILARKPELVLVDELAHTNVPGLRHVRRFQDVEEFLKVGINVYTTLNIQHIESLNDVVAQITNVVVRETVPDYIVEQADNVQLVDIPSEDLIKRLQEGKVYIPSQAEKALKKFFRLGNINALRELALRFTAQRVDHDLAQYMREHQIEGPWPAAGRVMVCVSTSPFSTQLIRAARRLAVGLQSDWLAVHIDSSRRFPMSDAARDRVVRNMRLAEELGAKTLNISATDFVEEILHVARINNVTAIVIGKPRKSRVWELLHGSIVDRLIRESGGINIYVIQANEEKKQTVPIATKPVSVDGLIWKYYGLSLLMVSAVTLFGFLLKNHIELINIALLYQLPVTMSAFWWGRWPSYFAAIMSMLLFDFLFIPPVFTFTVDDVRYIWSFAIFLVVAFVIGGRTDLLKGEADAARQRENSTRALYKFGREIVGVIDLETISKELAMQTADNLRRKIVVLLPDENNQLLIWAERNPDIVIQENSPLPKYIEDSIEAAVATWVYEHHEIAGRSTDTLPNSKYLYLPLTTRNSTVGVLGLHIVENLITPEQRRLMEVWASMAAIAIERIHLVAKAQEAALLLKSDQLFTALFNSISHELRTPLASVIGSVVTVLEAEDLYSPEERRELLENIKEGANRMDHIITNLLDTARLESGMMQLKIDWCDMEDVVKTSLWRMKGQIEHRSVEVTITPAIPMVRGDFVLLEQVMVNLVDNALKYSSAESQISIKINLEKSKVKVSVADQGIGIPEEELSHIFDKFYRVQQRDKKTMGTGLGLSICKGIIEAHDGEIWAENRKGGGVIISFLLPVADK